MSTFRNYHLFISHAWEYNDDYYRLVNLLNLDPYFSWSNYSVPQHASFGIGTNVELRAALDQQIQLVSAFIRISGMYINHREWIQEEINIAQ